MKVKLRQIYWDRNYWGLCKERYLMYRRIGLFARNI